jgi:signal transduction histidine kinase
MGAIRGAVVINEDITARRAIEAERERLLASEQAARSAAESALLVRDRVIAAVSHDLKSPLTVVLGIAQLLRRELSRAGGPDLSRVGDALTRIESSARSMTAMMDELIDAARLEIGQSLTLNREPVDLVALARRVLDRHQGASDRHHLSLESEKASIVGAWDAARLERVLDNLVTNAIKYSPDGGPVSVAQRADDGEAVLSVRDQGIGILADDLAQIFEPFRRGANVPERISGTGIGLAGVRQIVAQHGGWIAVESSEGAGSTFTVHLPLVAPPDAEDEEGSVLIAGDTAVAL